MNKCMHRTGRLSICRSLISGKKIGHGKTEIKLNILKVENLTVQGHCRLYFLSFLVYRNSTKPTNGGIANGEADEKLTIETSIDNTQRLCISAACRNGEFVCPQSKKKPLLFYGGYLIRF